MAEQSNSRVPDEPVAAEPVRARGKRSKRRRRAAWAAVALCLLWAIGQGLGLFGSAPRGEQGGKDGAGQGDPERLRTASGVAAKADAAVVPVAPKRAASHPGIGGAPAGEVPSEVAAGALAAGNSPADSGMDSDRFESLLSLLELHVEEHELGSAAGVVQQLHNQPLSKAQRTRLDRFAARLSPLQVAAEQRILQQVRSGDVLAADHSAAELVISGTWRAEALAQAAPQLAVGDNWQRALEPREQTAPRPTPLARNRQVRVRWRDQLRAGVVANSRADQVTVRLRTDKGQSFPTVPASACEPTDSTSAEAVEMGFAALHANAPRLARLWLLRAWLLSNELTQRGQQLLDQLR